MPLPPLPGFHAHPSAHYVFHARPGSLAEREMAEIIAAQEAVFARVSASLGVMPDYPLHYIFADSPEEVGRLYGDNIPCHACAIEPDMIYAVYNERDRCTGAHEDTHLIAYALCSQENALLSEGLAQHMEGTWHALSNREQARRLLPAGLYVPPSVLANDDAFWSLPPDTAYPIAGAFVTCLAEAHGLEGFLRLYYTASQPDLTVHDTDFLTWLTR